MSIIKSRCKFANKTRDLSWLHSFSTFVKIPQIIGKRWTLKIFHHDVGMSIGGIEIVDLYDVWMAQRSNNFGLTLKARFLIFICFDKTVHDLDCHGAVEGKVLAQIDLCHAALCKVFFDENFSDGFSYPIRHGRIIQREVMASLFEMVRKRILAMDQGSDKNP